MVSRKVLLGIVPLAMQTPPPSGLRSTTAPRLPSLAAWIADRWPPGPEPITIMSNWRAASAAVWPSPSGFNLTTRAVTTWPPLAGISAVEPTPRRFPQRPVNPAWPMTQSIIDNRRRFKHSAAASGPPIRLENPGLVPIILYNRARLLGAGTIVRL